MFIAENKTTTIDAKVRFVGLEIKFSYFLCSGSEEDNFAEPFWALFNLCIRFTILKSGNVIFVDFSKLAPCQMIEFWHHLFSFSEK